MARGAEDTGFGWGDDVGGKLVTEGGGRPVAMVGTKVGTAAGGEENTGCEFGAIEGGKFETRDAEGSAVRLGDGGGVDVAGRSVGSVVTPKSGAITIAINVVSLATPGSSSPSVPKVELFPGADWSAKGVR